MHPCCSAQHSSPDNSCTVHLQFWAQSPEQGPSTALEGSHKATTCHGLEKTGLTTNYLNRKRSFLYSPPGRLVLTEGEMYKRRKNQMIPGTILVPGFNKQLQHRDNRAVIPGELRPAKVL
ncbi:hypothetical protein BY996DRAFT_6423708 [Phakopsora pachyrhizi]|nr:hypothetical protein BY996DRAFT_6423708 [Phakopsora pachyrhizi]